jgi:hypothetical protein
MRSSYVCVCPSIPLFKLGGLWKVTLLPVYLFLHNFCYDAYAVTLLSVYVLLSPFLSLEAYERLPCCLYMYSFVIFVRRLMLSPCCLCPPQFCGFYSGHVVSKESRRLVLSTDCFLLSWLFNNVIINAIKRRIMILCVYS